MHARTLRVGLCNRAVKLTRNALSIGLLAALCSFAGPSGAADDVHRLARELGVAPALHPGASRVLDSNKKIRAKGNKNKKNKMHKKNARRAQDHRRGAAKGRAVAHGREAAAAGSVAVSAQAVSVGDPQVRTQSNQAAVAAATAVSSTDNDVVIVGAGAAGLYAAYVLTNLGYDVLVVEASSTHGGRVHSSILGDVQIEHGAEELYGPLNNFVYNDIQSFYGVGSQIEIFTGSSTQDTLISMDGGNTCFATTGNCDQDPDIYDYWNFYYDIGNHSNDPTDVTVADHMSNVLGIGPTHRAYHLYEALSPAGEYGTTVERLSLRSLSRQPWDMSSKVYGLAPTGYLDALDTLYFNSILSKVLLNSPVTVVDTSGIKPVAIDANGVYHYADAIIVTVSLGVLKAGLINFVPGLPAAKQNAIATLGMGKGMKMSLRFSSQFWANKMFVAVTEGPTGECWVPEKYQPGALDHVLTCFLMGRNGEAMTALPNDAARINQALSDLDQMFGNAATPAYIEGHIHDWTSDPYVLGSYSYPSVGSYPAGLSMRQILAQPVGTTLYFAGEATHNSAAATVPGALRSGERAAGEHNTASGGPPAPGTPTADFSASLTSGNAPFNVDFTDLSSEFPSGWAWNFGDSGTSGIQHPTHQYATPGSYTVSLTASNAIGTHTRVQPNLVVVSVPEPSAIASLVAGAFTLALLQAHRKSTRTRRSAWPVPS